MIKIRVFAIIALSLTIQFVSGQAKNVTICWDVSKSMAVGNHEKEFYFLDAYFKDVKAANVTLLTFANQLISKEEFSVVGSDWSLIKKNLQYQNYDGGTSFEGLESFAQNGDVLLFTDGKQTVGSATPKFNGGVFIVNGKKDFDRANLNLLAIINNGNLVNLSENKDSNNQSDNTQIYSGNIYQGTTGLANAQVYIKGNKDEFSKSDSSGNFSVHARVGDTLVILYDNKRKEQVLGDNRSIDFSFGDEGIQLKEVVVTEEAKTAVNEVTTGYGKENKEKLGYAVQSIDDEDISDIAITANNAVQGKFSGVRLGQNDDLSQVIMRPSNSILGNNYGLIVVDGVPLAQARTGFKGLGDQQAAPSNASGMANDVPGTGFIDPNNIAEITVLKGLAATNRFGSMGANGVLLITTKTATVNQIKEERKDLALLTDNIYDVKVKVNNKSLVTPYLKELKKGKNLQEAYDIYLKQRDNYATSEYLLDVYSFFHGSSPEIAKRVLTNILEKEQPSYEELRGMYLQTTESAYYDLALITANRMLEVFPNKIQSYFDVGMANNMVENYQEALIMFNRIIDGTANSKLNFQKIEKVVGAEIRNLVNKERKHIDISKVDQKYRNNLTYNARLVLDWTNADAEFVVQFVNPQKRFFNWEHTETSDRKRILDELQQGFSIEPFEIVGADTIGDWLLNVTYLGNRTEGNKTPTFLKCKVQYNFGKPNQRNEEFIVRLQESGNEQQLAKFTVK
ncbi:TonB-dependent receptor plug domain-containing protein [Flagellimonas onchidii]|uniref:TonB-dependent receptor plug domain-containing protein n=1 Tax=Flagellimonas onchidii TaxID=2562684 RepID=UPI0010A69CFB|nr:TonB-dependent receptor plug domain-containing protein [Allomuricauda onchidii]